MRTVTRFISSSMSASSGGSGCDKGEGATVLVSAAGAAASGRAAVAGGELTVGEAGEAL